MIVVGPGGQRALVRSPEKTFPLGHGRPRTYAPSAGNVPLLTRDVTSATYEAMYRHQPWVYILVNKLIRAISRNPWKTYREDPAGTHRERVRDHPLAHLLSHPWKGGTAYGLKESIVGSMYVHANALVFKARPGPGQPPRELWPLPWRHIEVVSDGSGLLVDHYVFHGERDRLRIHPDDVMHYRLYGLGTAVGIAPMEALRRTLATEDAAQIYQAEGFRNRATVSGVFSAKGRLKEGTPERMRTQLDHLYGGVENTGRFAIVDQDMTFSTVQHSAVDMAVIDQRKLSREEVAAAFDVPPPAIGILDRATFSNITEQRRMLYVDTVGPPAEYIAEVTQAQLVDGEAAYDGVFTEFDLSAVLQGDPERRSQSYQRWIQGVYTPDELRRLENLPPVGGDAAKLWMPANLIPVGATHEDIEARARLLEAAARLAAAGVEVPPPSNGHDPDLAPGDIAPMVDA